MTCTPRNTVSILGLAIALTLCASAIASPPPVATGKGTLVTAKGMALYAYATDGSTGISHCEGSCASVWPPYLADPGAHPAQGFSLTTRPDHSLQWNYQGQPLYRYAGDTKPGEARGDGLNGVWHVVSVH